MPCFAGSLLKLAESRRCPSDGAVAHLSQNNQLLSSKHDSWAAHRRARAAPRSERARARQHSCCLARPSVLGPRHSRWYSPARPGPAASNRACARRRRQTRALCVAGLRVAHRAVAAGLAGQVHLHGATTQGLARSALHHLALDFGRARGRVVAHARR